MLAESATNQPRSCARCSTVSRWASTARFKSGDSSPNFSVLARSILGERSKIFSLVVEEGRLVVAIESKILNLKGFPVALEKDDVVPEVINAALAIET